MTHTKRSSIALFGLVFLAMSVLTFGIRPATSEDADAQPVVEEKNDEEPRLRKPVSKVEAVQRSEEVKKAIVAITKLGGKVEFDNKQLGKPVIGVVLNKVTDAGLVHLAQLPALGVLDVRNTAVSSAALDRLRDATRKRLWDVP